MRYSYTSIDAIFAKHLRDLGTIESEDDVIEWTAEALDFIGAARSYEEAVAFIEVKNFTAPLPKFLKSIIQIARNNQWNGSNRDLFCPKNVAEVLEDREEDGVKVPVALNCMGMPKHEYDLAYYRPYYDLKYEYDFWRRSSYYNSIFTPVRLTTHSFFNTIVCKESDYDYLYNNVHDEYSIDKASSSLRFSFEEGQIAIAYLRQPVDFETGYPKIPDHISYKTAIVKYITLKVMEKRFYAGRQGAKGMMDDAQFKWDKYCRQAGNVDKMPHGEDEYQNMTDGRNYIMPQQNAYFKFFGNLNNPEQRNFLDPNNRNGNRFYAR